VQFFIFAKVYVFALLFGIIAELCIKTTIFYVIQIMIHT